MEYQESIRLNKIIGIIAIFLFSTVPIQSYLYFMYSEVPPIWNVLLRTLLAVLSLILVLVFFTGLKEIIKNYKYKNYCLLNLMYNTVCIYIAINLVAHSLEAGSVLNPEGNAIDATQDGILAQGNYLLYGSISRLLMALYMVLCGIISMKIFPKWTCYIAIIIGIINIIFVPSMFFGTNTGDFYSAIGWGNSAIAASLFTIWVFIIGIILLKNEQPRRKAAQKAA